MQLTKNTLHRNTNSLRFSQNNLLFTRQNTLFIKKKSLHFSNFWAVANLVPHPSVTKINHLTIGAEPSAPVFVLLFRRFTPSIRSEEEPSDPTSPTCYNAAAAGLPSDQHRPNAHLRRRRPLLQTTLLQPAASPPPVYPGGSMLPPSGATSSSVPHPR